MAASSADATGLAPASSGPLAAQHVAPPLQADFAGQRLARHLAHARHLDVEGIERMQRAAMFRRREQRGEKAVAIGRPDQLGAIGECILHDDASLCISSIAIRPAPTRRLSISITL